MTLKRLLSVVLLCVVLVSCFSGCNKKSANDPLRIFIDISRGTDYTSNYDEEMIEEIRTRVAETGGPEDFEIELVEIHDADVRSEQITRIRTEMMAGNGPDIFITDFSGPVDSLFLEPEKSMELGVFYPLDDFLEDAKYMSIPDMNQTVLAAGKCETYGQVILPITFHFPITLFSQTSDEPTKALTWDEAIRDDGSMTQVAAAPSRFADSDDFVNAQCYPQLTFGKLIDAKEKKLLFTEDELMSRVEDFIYLLDKRANGDYDEISRFQIAGMGSGYAKSNNSGDPNECIDVTELKDQTSNDDIETIENNELTMVPVYNDDGGVTAEVSMFAAIDANTGRAEDAFSILDALLDKEFIRTSKLFQWNHENNMSIYDDVMSRDATVKRVGERNRWALSNSNFENYAAIRDQINAVNFRGTISSELDELVHFIFQSHFGHSNEDAETLVHFAYERMTQELNE